MTAKRNHKNRRSRSQQRSKNARRGQTQRASASVAPSSKQAPELHQPPSLEPLPSTPETAAVAIPSEPEPSVAVSAVPSELGVTPVESSFFEIEEPVVAASEPEIEEEAAPLRLSPEHLMRRTMFRRHVTRLMTGMGMFTLVTLVMRVAAGV